VNIDHSLPIYIQIQETLRKGIEEGIYKPGDRLPSETELAKQFSTTRATVVHAMHGLLFEGLIERLRGRGTFVAKPAIVTTVNTQVLGFFEQDMLTSGRTVFYRVLSFKAVSNTQQIQEKLAVNPSESVHQLIRQRIVEQQPIAVEIRYMPSLTALRIQQSQLEKLAIQTIFQEQLGLTIDTINNQVRVGLATKDIADWLEIKRHRPVMIRSHSYLSHDKQPLLWGETVYREEYEIHYTSQQSGITHALR
jgi:GntR family transcriptional regulator